MPSVEALVDSFPEAARIVDQEGKLPVHYAVSRGVRAAALPHRYAPRDSPSVKCHVTAEIRLSPHLTPPPLSTPSTRAQAPVEVVHLLLKVHPNGAMERSARSNLLPLHVAVSSPLSPLTALSPP